jgi:hypothetical protein
MFTAKITSPTVIPSGPVTFKAGTTVLGTAQVSAGKAIFATSALPAESRSAKLRSLRGATQGIRVAFVGGV